MKPFLLLATRPEDRAADEEYAAFLRLGELDRSQLRRIRLEQQPFDEALGPGFTLDDYSAVIVGGSPFTTSDAVKTATQLRVEQELAALLDDVVARDFPFLGACYGIGTLGVHQGGVIDTTYGEPVRAVPVTLTQAGREDPLLGVLPETFEAFVGHKEAVTVLPPSAVLLASSPECPVQAFRVGRNVYATQFHPELDVPGILTRIEIYRDAGYFPAETLPELKATLAAASVTLPPLLVRRFIELHSRP